MRNFFQLLINEQIKLYIRKSTWIMYILIAALILGLALLANFGVENSGTYQASQDDNW